MICNSCGILNNEKAPRCRNCKTRLFLTKRQGRDYAEFKNGRVIKWWEFALIATCILIVPGIVMGGIYFVPKRSLAYTYLVATLAVVVLYFVAYLCLDGIKDLLKAV